MKKCPTPAISDKYISTPLEISPLKKHHPNKTLIKSFRLTEVDFAMIEKECRRRNVVFSVLVRKAIMAAALEPEGSKHSVKGAGHD
jgi:hypothetical protein